MKIVIALLTSFMLLSQSLYASDDIDCSKRRSLKTMMKSLELTDKQKEEMKSIMQASHEEIKHARQEMRKVRKDLKELAMQDKYDSEKLKQLIKLKTTLMSSNMKKRFDSRHKIYLLLTDEQKKKLKEVMAEYKAYYKKCRKKRR